MVFDEGRTQRINYMCQNFLSLLKNCSSGSKKNLSNFLQDLFPSQTAPQDSVQGQLEEIFKKITKEFSLSKVRQISRNERNRKDLTTYQYNYGQITFRTIFKIINKIKKFKPLGHNEVFYDLGSGSGKVLLAASFCFPFLKCKGIQCLESLFSTSQDLKKKVQGQAKQLEQNISSIMNEDYRLPSFQLYNDNFQQMKWDDGTIIFVSSTCYTRQMMTKIQELCEQLAKEAIVITLTRSLQNFNGSWKVMQKFEGQTSWGPCTVFIHSHHN